MIQVLFVCLGNICRSPMAEAIFAHLVQQAELNEKIFTDSAGTSNYHPDEPPDRRTLQVLKQNGIFTQHRARQIRHQDFESFDYVVAMDHQNLENMHRWVRQQPPLKARLCLMGEFELDCSTPRAVPDPYYGDLADFEEVYAMLLPACEKLLQDIRREHAF